MLKNEVKAINRHRWISEAAYYRAKARGFEPGKELNDWLEAEKEYAKMLIALYSSILEEDGAMTILNLLSSTKLIRYVKGRHCETSMERFGFP